MKHYTYISGFVLLLALLLYGCSNTRFLPEDEILYTGRKSVKVIQKEEGIKKSEVNATLRFFSSHKVNNSLFGQRVLPPVGLWVHNYWEVKEGKKLGKWLYNSMEAPPILVSDVKPELRAEKIESELFDNGYFKSHAWAVLDTSTRNSKKARVSYFLEVEKPYHYQKVELRVSEASIDSLFSKDVFKKHLEPEDVFNLKTLIDVRTRLSRQIQELGYFYFTPDYIDLQADTALGNKHLNLVIQAKKNIPPLAKKKYAIKSLKIFISGPSDTASIYPAPLRYDDLLIHSTDHYIKPQILRKAVFLHEGELYSYSSHQKTVTRLNNLGIFSYVNISYVATEEDSLQGMLDVRIDLKMAQNINLDFAADMIMKSTGFMGPALAVGLSHGNTFKGAERVHLQLTGGFEWQWGPKEEYPLGSFSYDVGVNTGLSFPRILIPGSKSRILPINKQQTSVNLSFNLMNRTAYYSMVSALAHLNYSWGKRKEILHSFSPLFIQSVSLLETTPEFDSIYDENIYIRKSYEEQFIMGMKYNFTFDNTMTLKPRNFYFQAGISTAGNMADLIISQMKDPSERPYEVLGRVYSQHVKLSTDFRYYLNGRNKSLAMRMYAGIGMPYLNSDVLPYVEQFFSGGAYSIRGFTARTVGPGSFHDTEESDYIDQSGDVKLEANLEYRFGLSKIVKGAVFIDVGNIWLVNEDDQRPGSGFEFQNFMEELAVGAGIGLRFDFTFFVLRTDVGVPLRTPYLQDGSNWQITTGNFFSDALFYLAIGYPF